MPRLDTLLVVHTVHTQSRWRHVSCRDAYAALVKAADLGRGRRLLPEIRGSLVLSALAQCGLSVERGAVSRRLLSSICVVDGHDGRHTHSSLNQPSQILLTENALVSLPRFAALLALQVSISHLPRSDD